MTWLCSLLQQAGSDGISLVCLSQGLGGADAKSALWQLQFEDADPYIVLWQLLPCLPSSEDTVPGSCAVVPGPDAGQ